VALLIEASRAYGRGLLSGIAGFVREHQNWSVLYEEWTWADAPPGWLKGWDGDGIIVRLETQGMAAAIQPLKIPKVDVRGSVSGLNIPLIDTDDHEVASMAANHLLERGFRHCAFCGFVGANYSDKRSTWFRECITKAGVACDIYTPPSVLAGGDTIEVEKWSLQFDEDLMDWLKYLPKPVGIMACNDIRGQQVINACRRLDLMVPDEVAVIGVDNDEVLCELSDPPLSSVVPNCGRIGYDAARLLDSLMEGKPAPPSPMYVQPAGIVTRRSTDVLAISDRAIASVVRHIRDHACEGLSVANLVHVAALSRSVFEHRFRKLVGRSPKAEIMRVQLQRAKQLLTESDMTLTGIADKCGFKYPEYFSAVFRLKTGITPGGFREQMRQDRSG
jgi:LacI family transcriptional regulator